MIILKAFNGLPQADRKILITTDTIDYSTSNIAHIPFDRFLFVNSLDEIR